MKIKVFLLSLIVLGILAGAVPAQAPYPIYYPLSGQIERGPGVSADIPLGGRTVRFYCDLSRGAATAETANDGSFTIQIFDIWDQISIGLDYFVDSPLLNDYGVSFTKITPDYLTWKGYDDIPAGVLVLTTEVVVPGYAQITGTVKDTDNNPIKDALVKADERAFATDASGAYSIINLTPGTYTVSAAKTGYTSSSETVSVASDETKTVNFVLAAVPALPVETKILVTVTDIALGVPIAGADVEIIGGAKAITDAGGKCGFTVDPGTYQMKVTKQYYIPKTETVSVSQGETKQVTILIKLSSPPAVKHLRFGERLYQPVLVAKGQKFVVSQRPRITASVTNEPDSGIAQGTIAVVLDAGTPGSKIFGAAEVVISNIKTQSVAGAQKVSEMSIKLDVPESSQLPEGTHVFSFMVENDYGVSASYSATVEVMGGPLRIIGTPITFPSPFSITKQGTVTIQYELSADGNITLYLTSPTGEIIKRWNLPAGAEGGSAGVNKITWNGRSDQGYLAGNAIYLGSIISRDDNRLLAKYKLTIVD